MTILEAYKKLEAELPDSASFAIEQSIRRYGKRIYETTLPRTRLEFTVDIQRNGRQSQKSGDDLAAAVAMALDDFNPSRVGEDRIAEASAQAVEAIHVLI